MKIGLFSLIFVFANFCFQFSLLSFPEEVYQKMIAQDYEGMRALVAKIIEGDIIAPMPKNHSFWNNNHAKSLCRKNCLGSLNGCSLTIFHIAAFLGDLEGLDVLLQEYPNCVDLAGEDTHYTPLSIACHSSDPKVLPVVDLLLKAGADINNVDKNGYPWAELNPLSAACKACNYPLVEFLFFRGAKVKYLSTGAIEDMLFKRERFINTGAKIMMKDPNKAALLITDLLFQYAEESEIKKLQAAVKYTLISGTCSSHDIDKENETALREVERSWVAHDKRSVKRFLSYMTESFMRKYGYSYRETRENDSVFSDYPIERCYNNPNASAIIVNERNMDYAGDTLTLLLNTRYKNMRRGIYPMPRQNREKILKELSRNPLIDDEENIIDILRSREIGNKIVRK